MVHSDKLEAQIINNERKLKELTIQIENIQRETHELFNELNICPIHFAAFIENKDNFSESDWIMLQEQKKKLDEKLDLAMNNLPDLAQRRKALNELNMSRNWLFVK